MGDRPRDDVTSELIQSGDAAFDSLVAVRSSLLISAAALDQTTRKCLIKLLHESQTSPAGAVSNTIAELSATEIMKECPALVKLAKSASPRRLVAEHIRPAVGPVARDAIRSPDPTTRLRTAELAAHHIDPAVIHSSLLDLARGPHTVALRVRAIELSGQQQASIAELREEMTKLLRDESEQVRSAAFELLGARGWLPEGGTLALAPSEGGELSLSGSPVPDLEPKQ